MKKSISLLLALMLVLSVLAGCRAGTPDNPDPADENQTEAPSMPAGTLEPAPATQNPVPGTPEPADTDPPVTADGGALDDSPREKLLARAGQHDLLAVLTDPGSEEYIAFDDASARSYEIHPGGDTILVVPLKDNIKMSVISVAYDEESMSLNWEDTLFEFSGVFGEPVKLTAVLSEGIPLLMLYAEYEDMCAYWYIAYDGKGAESVRFLTGVSIEGFEREE